MGREYEEDDFETTLPFTKDAISEGPERSARAGARECDLWKGAKIRGIGVPRTPLESQIKRPDNPKIHQATRFEAEAFLQEALVALGSPGPSEIEP